MIMDVDWKRLSTKLKFTICLCVDLFVLRWCFNGLFSFFSSYEKVSRIFGALLLSCSFNAGWKVFDEGTQHVVWCATNPSAIFMIAKIRRKSVATVRNGIDFIFIRFWFGNVGMLGVVCYVRDSTDFTEFMNKLDLFFDDVPRAKLRSKIAHLNLPLRRSWEIMWNEFNLKAREYQMVGCSDARRNQTRRVYERLGIRTTLAFLSTKYQRL